MENKCFSFCDLDTWRFNDSNPISDLDNAMTACCFLLEYFTWFLCLLGLPGNSLIIVTVLRSHPLTPATFLIVYLAAVDSGTLVIRLIEYQLFYHNVYFMDTSCQYLDVFGMASKAISNWTHVLIGIERFISVYFPIERLVYLTVKKTKLFTAGMSFTLIAAVIIYQQVFIETGTCNYVYISQEMSLILNIIFRYCLPTILLLVLTVLVIGRFLYLYRDPLRKFRAVDSTATEIRVSNTSQTGGWTQGLLVSDCLSPSLKDINAIRIAEMSKILRDLTFFYPLNLFLHLLIIVCLLCITCHAAIDPCPYGWLHDPSSSSCYYLTDDTSEKLSFNSAVQKCKWLNSELATIAGDIHLIWLGQQIHIRPSRQDGWWIGYVRKESGLTLVDGSEAEETIVSLDHFWADSGTLGCVSLMEGAFQSKDCSQKLGYICKRAKATDRDCDADDYFVYIQGSCFSYIRQERYQGNGICPVLKHTDTQIQILTSSCNKTNRFICEKSP
ncbi:hypothetical protein Btru_061240, partial [Bulinus truncatus]